MISVSLTTPCKNCSHTRNFHETYARRRGVLGTKCLICSCDTFEPDPCYWGHSQYCEHQDSPYFQNLPGGDVDSSARPPLGFDSEASNPLCESRYNPGSNIVYTCERVLGHRHLHRRGTVSWTDETAMQAGTRESQVGGNHYRKFKIQPWDVIDEYRLTFYAGNALKYLLRAGHKGVALEDLKKARHYLDRMIEIEENKET